MAERNFFNENEYRAYPLIEVGRPRFIDTKDVPLGALVDAGFTLGLHSGFSHVLHTVGLTGVDVAAGSIDFIFHCTALPGYRWVFTAPLDTPFGAALYAPLVHISENTEHPELGLGFINVGRLSAAAALGLGPHSLGEPLQVEPALVRSLVKGFVQSVAPANAPRLCPATCHGGGSPAAPAGTAFLVDAVPLTGVVSFKEGNNCRIEARAFENALLIAGQVGAGLGEPCEDVRVDANGLRRGDACVPCDGFIATVNGKGAKDGVMLLGGLQGVKVTNEPEAHRVIVELEGNRVC